MTGPHLVVIGMMGAGKTTVARLLSRRLGLCCIDTDVLVVQTAGRTIAEIFEESGEPGFRAAETEALEHTLLCPERAVVAVGGGAVLATRNRELLGAHSTVVWLRANVRTILTRVGSGEGRPMLAGGTEKRVRRLDEVRRPLYAQLADAIVDVDHITPMQVVARIVDELGLEA